MLRLNLKVLLLRRSAGLALLVGCCLCGNFADSDAYRFDRGAFVLPVNSAQWARC